MHRKNPISKERKAKLCRTIRTQTRRTTRLRTTQRIRHPQTTARRVKTRKIARTARTTNLILKYFGAVAYAATP